LTKIELGPIKEAVRENARLREENATLREVNALQVEQLRKAQERIRAAEAREVRAWNDALEACGRIAEDRDEEGSEYGLAARQIARAIRSLAKEAGE
jgi:hypothetical protein